MHMCAQTCMHVEARACMFHKQNAGIHTNMTGHVHASMYSSAFTEAARKYICLLAMTNQITYTPSLRGQKHTRTLFQS